MILCVCQAISDREVDAAIRAGARSLIEVQAACGAANDCGCCRRAIEKRIERACTDSCAECPRRGLPMTSAAL